MAAKKIERAKPIGVARKLRTFRLNPEILQILSKFCKTTKKAEVDVIEAALYDYLTR